ncbi:MAG: TIGR02678 family protein [Actinomycetales bacterium]|nr:TIGR02678 family protein [Actinomycetales bacterium]
MSPAPSTSSHEAAVRRDAARALLRHPLLTDRTYPDELAAVRVHARELTSLFGQQLGYRLIVEPSFARLLKEPPGPAAPWRGATRRSGTPFTPRTYTYLALVCAALLSAEIGDQVLASRLFEQVRAEGHLAGVDPGDNYQDRRQLVTALEWLIDLGVLEETDGSVGGWGDRRDEALLSVNRTVLPHLISRPLHSLPGPDALLEEGPVGFGLDQPRRSLRRKLAEQPVVDRDTMTDAERDVMSRERTELTRTLADAFGLHLEVRSEGALAFDVDAQATDVTFPSQGTVAQAALLLIDAAIDTHRPTALTTASVNGRVVRGQGVSYAEVDEHLAHLVTRYGKGWSATYTHDVAGLRAAVVALLTSMGLAHDDGEQVVLLAACGRFRPLPHAAPSMTRARARLHAAPAPTPPSLFDEETS